MPLYKNVASLVFRLSDEKWIHNYALCCKLCEATLRGNYPSHGKESVLMNEHSFLFQSRFVNEFAVHRSLCHIPIGSRPHVPFFIRKLKQGVGTYSYTLENLSPKSAILDRFASKNTKNKQIWCFEKSISKKVPTPCYRLISIANTVLAVPRSHPGANTVSKSF